MWQNRGQGGCRKQGRGAWRRLAHAGPRARGLGHRGSLPAGGCHERPFGFQLCPTQGPRRGPRGSPPLSPRASSGAPALVGSEGPPSWFWRTLAPRAEGLQGDPAPGSWRSAEAEQASATTTLTGPLPGKRDEVAWQRGRGGGPASKAPASSPAHPPAVASAASRTKRCSPFRAKKINK